MPRITADLLRKRAEHNDGKLRDLEEIALHQEEIERIELFESLTRHIKILLMQNNQVEKFENLGKLKELEYLNLALNNIEMIENLEGCESLNKLDLTCNFIPLSNFLESMTNLRKVASIKELYLLGNPCVDWPKHRQIVIVMVPQLIHIDGKEITPEERIKAAQQFDDLVEEMEDEVDRLEEEYQKKTPEEKKKRYSKADRKLQFEEDRKEQDVKDKKEKDKLPPPKKESSIYNRSGELRMCNEGKYKFRLQEYEDPVWSYFEMDIPRYLETHQLDANIYPEMVSVRVKGKLTQIKLWEEVIVDQSKIQRSELTGILHFSLKKKKTNPYACKNFGGDDSEDSLENSVTKIRRKKRKNSISQEKVEQDPNTPFYTGIENVKEVSETVKERLAREEELERQIEEDEDLDDLPPLE